MSPRNSKPARRLAQGTGAVAACLALTAGTAWACPPEPGYPQTKTTQAGAASAQAEGQNAGGHAGHTRRVEKSAAVTSEAIKGVQRVGGVTDAKGAISLMFIDYGKGRAKRTIMYATGDFGLKAYDITADPRSPKLVGQLNMPGMWETEDTDFDPKRKIIYLSRDPRAFGGNTATGESGVYIVDASKPEKLRQITYVKVPAGHTTTCVNDCRYLWTGGPAKASWMPADWGGRPVWVTDVRNPRKPKVFKNPIDTGRNDGKTDYTHDIQVDSNGVAWASGRGGVRGYYTKGRHYDPLKKKSRVATASDPVPYAGGGIDEATTNSSFMHNSYRAVGRTAGQAANPKKWGNGKLLFVTEETFADGCANDGLLVVASLKGSYKGEGWRSTPDKKFRLRTVATWGVAGKEGSDPNSKDCSAHYFDVKNGVIAQSFYSQGTRFLDVRDPTNIKQLAYYRPADAQSWQPYWHGKYVYVADNNRGIDVLKPAFR
ncbi:LVIVD repeat-containing protein [Spirillospora sp. NPDC048911]|uniref:LVIVD repeat-containing protein n=1 Tax=Spirillospora sp. NPDC048911 TaxID=3364527 RepID=UPI0037145ED8